MTELESLRLEVERLRLLKAEKEAQIECLLGGYQQIIDSSDYEMRDGDLAREIAEAMRRTDDDAKSG